MAGVNLAILIGNLGRDPELRYTPNGQAVATFSLATTEKWRDKDGQLSDKTVWHNIVCWGKQAEIVNQYLKKGSPIYIEGRIQNRSYDDKDGNRKYISEIVARKVQFLGRKTEGASETQSASSISEDIPETDDDLPF